MNAYAMWPQAKVDRLIALWNEGKSASAIGTEMGISRNAVLGRIYRLRGQGMQIKQHEYQFPEKLVALWREGKSASEIGAEVGMTACAVKSRASRLRRRGIPLEHHTRQLIPQMRIREAVIYVPKFKPLPEPLIVDTLEGSVSLHEMSGCKWPVTPGPPHRFCNRVRFENLPYCEGHALRSFRPIERKK